MSNHPSQTKAFVAGIITASLSFFICQTIAKRSEKYQNKIKKTRSISFQKASSNSNDNGNDGKCKDETLEMDSPDLPLRMIRKAETAILRRTSRIIVVVERCTNEHNYSAILRTCEALGIQNVWLVSPRKSTIDLNGEIETPDDIHYEYNEQSDSNDFRVTRKIQSFTGKVISLTDAEIESRTNHAIFAQRAAEWLTIREFDTTSSCIEALRQDNREIWATDLSQEADCLTLEGLTNVTDNDGNSNVKDHNLSNHNNSSVIPTRLAIVFGTEAVGCSNEILTAAHRRVYIPLHGFADSLNLSVATALCLLQIFHLEPQCVGSMSESERRALREIWYPKLATQRIMTSAQKKKRGKLVRKVREMEKIERKKALGLGELTIEQEEKLKIGGRYRMELEQLDKRIQTQANLSVSNLIDNPPSPLSDMRRADEHRTCYVGKNTRKRNEDNWKDMPAVINADSHNRKGISCSYFRELVPDNSNKGTDAINVDD